MNTSEMIAYCQRLMSKYGEDVVLDFNYLRVYDFENNLLESVR